MAFFSGTHASDLLSHICVHVVHVFAMVSIAGEVNGAAATGTVLRSSRFLGENKSRGNAPLRNNRQRRRSEICQFCGRKVCEPWCQSRLWPSTVAVSSLRKRRTESEILTPQTQECGVCMGSFIWHEEKCFLGEFTKPHPTLAHTPTHTPTHLKSKAPKTPTHKSNV